MNELETREWARDFVTKWSRLGGEQYTHLGDQPGNPHHADQCMECLLVNSLVKAEAKSRA